MEDNKDVQVTEEKVENTKTYTKENIDDSFNAGFKKAKSELENSDDYKQYLNWKKNNQNDTEKLHEMTAKYKELNEKYDEVLKDRDYSKNLMQVINTDCKPEFRKFVTNEVMGMVDDKVSFENALSNYKKQNPQFFGEVVVKKVQSSPNLSNGGPKGITTNDIMNNLLRGNR